MPERDPVHNPDVAGYVLGVLDPVETQHFTAHLAGCPECRREVAELAPVRLQLDRGMPAPPLPAHVARRAFDAVERAADEDTPAPASGERPEVVRHPARRRRISAAAAAAVAGVAALVAGLFLTAGDDGPRAREVALVAAGGHQGEGVARLHRDDQGVVVELAVSGLPVPAEGSFYECWYVADDDSPAAQNRVTAGTFTVTGQGTTEVRMITAADYEHFPTIEVTLEPGDGDPRSTGPAVLRSRPRTRA